MSDNLKPRHTKKQSANVQKPKTNKSTQPDRNTLDESLMLMSVKSGPVSKALRDTLSALDSLDITPRQRAIARTDIEKMVSTLYMMVCLSEQAQLEKISLSSTHSRASRASRKSETKPKPVIPTPAELPSTSKVGKNPQQTPKAKGKGKKPGPTPNAKREDTRRKLAELIGALDESERQEILASSGLAGAPDDGVTEDHVPEV